MPDKKRIPLMFLLNFDDDDKDDEDNKDNTDKRDDNKVGNLNKCLSSQVYDQIQVI